MLNKSMLLEQTSLHCTSPLKTIFLITDTLLGLWGSYNGSRCAPCFQEVTSRCGEAGNTCAKHLVPIKEGPECRGPAWAGEENQKGLRQRNRPHSLDDGSDDGPEIHTQSHPWKLLSSVISLLWVSNCSSQLENCVESNITSFLSKETLVTPCCSLMAETPSCDPLLFPASPSNSLFQMSQPRRVYALA